MNRDELLALPVTVDVWPTAAAVFEVSRMTAYRLAKSGDFPVPVIKVGRKYRVSTAEIFKKLGIDPNQRGELMLRPGENPNGVAAQKVGGAAVG